MSNNPQIEFVLFGKRPIPGHVKTRLFPDDTDLSCLFYEAFIKDFALRYSRYCDLPLRPFTDDQREESFLANYFNEKVLLPNIIQSDEAFFPRLANGLKKVTSPYFYLTGTDLPHFPFHFLNNVEINPKKVTIGPDEDGGFYFFAGPKESSSLFSLEPIGTSIYEALKKRFEDAGFEVHVLEPWSDIDTFDDLKKCIEIMSPQELPHTFDIFFREE